MLKNLYSPKLLLFIAVLGLFSCDDDDETPNLRTKMDYSLVTPETSYDLLFVDDDGFFTVDLSEGNTRHKMFQALSYYSTSSVSANSHIDAVKLKNMFSNTAAPFTDISTSSIVVTGSVLNASGVQLKNVTASSRPTAEAEAVRAKIESLFTEIDVASTSISKTASAGVAGKLGSYLLDAKGIETAQIIQKSLIGALQLDYIGNVLLDEGLLADNHTFVAGTNYTQREHNWDVAYSFLTLQHVYLQGATDQTRTTLEFAAGAYIWEYNKPSYAKFHTAFLMGRAAIVNNDNAELTEQATFIRTEFEKAIARAAVGYLDKWKTAEATATNPVEAVRAHAIGEGVGFIYSLRFAEKHGADAAFSDSVLANLIGSANGFWDLNNDKINAASDAIKDKFDL
jgi:hypothetical protein